MARNFKDLRRTLNILALGGHSDSLRLPSSTWKKADYGAPAPVATGNWRNWVLHSTAGLNLFQFQLAFVFFDESLKIGDGVEEFRPLLVVKGHGEAAESVHAHAALFADAELDGAAFLFCFYLFFEINQASFEFFVTWLCHECTSVGMVNIFLS